MLDLIKKWATFTLLISPDAAAMLLLGMMMEVLYRICKALNFLESGMEFFALGFGVVVFSVLFSFKLFVYFVKKRNKKRNKKKL